MVLDVVVLGWWGMGEGEVQREWDLYRFIHEIAKGMEHLHANGVLHGDGFYRPLVSYVDEDLIL